MNAEQFTKWLQKEAETLFYQDSTPEAFMNKVKPLIEELTKTTAAENFSERDLHEILMGKKSQKSATHAPQNSYFDIVDLALYRAN